MFSATDIEPSSVLIVDILSCAGWKGWQEEKAGEERRLSTVSAGAGGVVGGVVAVIVKVLGGG
jgi:hypothetical protein